MSRQDLLKFMNLMESIEQLDESVRGKQTRDVLKELFDTGMKAGEAYVNDSYSASQIQMFLDKGKRIADELVAAFGETVPVSETIEEAKTDPFSPEVVASLNAKKIKGVDKIGVAHPGIIVVLSPDLPVKEISGVLSYVEFALREIAGLKYFSRKVVAGLHGGSPFQVQIQAE